MSASPALERPSSRIRPPPLEDVGARISFRLADPDDAPELARLFHVYMDTTDWAEFITFDRPRAEAYLRSVIVHGFVPHLLAVEKGSDAIVGIVSYGIIHDFSVEPIALLHDIWVRADYRRGALGRMLVALVLDLARGDGANVFHAPIASGLPQTRSLRNLLRKAGFHEFGYMMRRGLA